VDTLYGGAGNDTYHPGLDRIVELAGEGIDTVVTGTNFDMGFTPHVERVIVTGTAAVSITGNAEANTIYGNAGHDRLYGNAGNDLIYGRSGNDPIYGGTGNDTVYGESGNDYLRGDAGNDALYGSIGNDKLIGDDGNDLLYGDAGNDVLIGGNHNDRLHGGIGKDYLTGGTGRDIFAFNTPLNRSTNVDKITDFSVPYDTIWLDNKYMTKLGSGTEARPGRLKPAFLAFDTADDTNDYLIYVRKSGVLLYDVDGSGSKAAVPIAILKPGLKLTYADFQII
jgi:Ca2+-binding RTX toxin-like protein